MSSEATEGMHQGQIVALYRKAMRWSQQDLAEALGLSLRTVQRMEQEVMIEDIERRKFLVGLLGIPAALMTLGDEEPSPIKKNSRPIFNDDLMVSLEEQLETRWEIFHIGGSNRAMRGLDRWMGEVATFAKAASGTAWHKRALAVLSMSYQLKGELLADKTHYTQADTLYTRAFRIAQELNDPELEAAVLVRKGVISMGQKQPQLAIQTLNGALEMIKGYGLPTLRGNILQVLADAYAQSQQPQACWHTLGMAESALQQRAQVRDRSQRVFTAASLTAHKGINALVLHDYERAGALLDKGLADYDPTFVPRRARLLVKKAEVHYGKGEIDACTLIAEEALALAYPTGARRVVARVQELHTTLTQSRWSKEKHVRRLGALLAMN